MWYGNDYGAWLKIPNADKAPCPMAPDNDNMFDDDRNWIGTLTSIDDEDGDEEDEDANTDTELEDVELENAEHDDIFVC